MDSNDSILLLQPSITKSPVRPNPNNLAIGTSSKRVGGYTKPEAKEEVVITSKARKKIDHKRVSTMYSNLRLEDFETETDE